MPAKKKNEAAPAETEQPTGDQGSALIKAAQTIGRVAGKLAVKTGIEHGNTPSSKKGKLPPKNKKRLPRREKKALQKSAASRV
jgi:hypothetical protein